MEVLNQVGNSSAIKDLLQALRDRDWWVRVRAADALGTIGGPRVVEAVLSLIKDKDEFVRRCAIEILIPTERARATKASFNLWWMPSTTTIGGSGSGLSTPSRAWAISERFPPFSA